MEDFETTILQARPGTNLLHFVKDPQSNEYRVPYTGDFAKDAVKLIYMSAPGAKAEDFERVWPEIWRLKEFHEPWHVASSSLAYAILDTGMLLEHPLLKPDLIESADFTGEGPDDYNGHGTICALLARVFIPYRVRMFNVKVVGSDGRGTSKQLIQGIHHVVELKKRHKIEHLIVNMSVGVYSRKFLGLKECEGDCDVCRATIAAAEEGILFMAAAGNTPGITACPATADIKKKAPGVTAVAASNYEKSGIGTIAAPGHIIGAIKV